MPHIQSDQSSSQPGENQDGINPYTYEDFQNYQQQKHARRDPTTNQGWYNVGVIDGYHQGRIDEGRAWSQLQKERFAQNHAQTQTHAQAQAQSESTPLVTGSIPAQSHPMAQVPPHMLMSRILPSPQQRWEHIQSIPNPQFREPGPPLTASDLVLAPVLKWNEGNIPTPILSAHTTIRPPSPTTVGATQAQQQHDQDQDQKMSGGEEDHDE